MPGLMWLVSLPFIASVGAFILPIKGKYVQRFSFLMSLLPLAILVYGGTNWIGSQISFAWLPQLSIEFYLRIDPLSLVFLFLTCIIVPISILAVPISSGRFFNAFYGLILLLQGFLIVFFTARDLVVFTLFWEAMLIPLYFIIAIWGGNRRENAALKFLIYMIAGSSLMVAAVLSLYFSAASIHGGDGTFNLDLLRRIASQIPHASWLWGIFLLAFSIKTPLFPFHAWLPDAYCEAPISGSILLSAILSKAGIYGIFRIGIELFPDLMKEWNPFLLGFAIAGVLYGGLAAWMQNDFKRLIAYSSLSHVNFILVGIFIWNQTAQAGALLQVLNHSITIAALFLAVGWLEERIESTAIGPFKGLAKYFPLLCWFTMVLVLSSVALPGTNNFVGEVMILFALFELNPLLAGILGLTVILSVIYMLRWMQSVYFDAPTISRNGWVDIGGKEIALALSLIVLIVWIGVYPGPILKQIEPAVGMQ